MSTETEDGIPLSERDKALGPCPVCGKKKWWFNNVPLTGYCWGTKNTGPFGGFI